MSSTIVCSMPGCNTTVGCQCRNRAGISGWFGQIQKDAAASPIPPDFIAESANKSEHHAESAYCSDHIVDEKQCRKCQRLLPGSHFRLKGRSKTKISDRCVDCQGSPAATWNSRNPDAAREAVLRFRENGGERRGRLRSQYGLTTMQFSELLRSQQGKCAICFAEEPGGRWKHFHVDHDHSTGKVRGLLCTNCNRGIGYMADDPERLKRAADYITDDANKMVSAGLPSEEEIHVAMFEAQRAFRAVRDADLAKQGYWPDRSPAPLDVLARAILDLIRPAFERAEADAKVFRINATSKLRALEDRTLSAEAKLAQAVEDEREACAKEAEAVGNYGSFRRDELTADYGQPRFDMMNQIAAAIRARSASAAARGETTTLAPGKEKP